MKVHRLTKKINLKMKYICKIRNNKLVITPRNRLIASGSGTSR